MRIRGATIAVLAAIVVGDSGLAFAQDEYNTRKLTYTNNGAYHARMKLHFKDSDGNQHKIGAKDALGAWWTNNPDSSTIDLKKIKERDEKKPVEQQKLKKLKKGDEVWVEIQIHVGNSRSCKKDRTRFLYDPNGGEAKFTTSGSTLQNNRCEIVCKSC